MKDYFKYIISLIIGFLGSYLANQAPEINLALSFLIFCGIVFLVLLFIQYVYPIIKSYLHMVFLSKIRGLWGDKYLDKVILNQYKNSSEIKIKVTRGINLFKKGKVFHQCLFVEKFNEEKTIKVLLHFPCLRSIHISERANANGIPKEEYVEDLFKLLKIFKEHSRDTSQDEKIFVKFYTSKKEKEWRYYIFHKHDNDKVLLFNHYNKKIQGSKSKMLKVKGGNSSLCDDLNFTFDNLYDNSSLELVSNLIEQDELMHSESCGHSECKTLINNLYKKHFNK
ncbi:hypothetical protein [uncultured Winogradskyella sp.]|uniref:hypothetical protein n=1 Tax=uncultured Winogradskyella sp. TaxID=395353 RepID=UPI0026386220|nr:hypothetical protein [uncultured Winogradskyella sp.]